MNGAGEAIGRNLPKNRALEAEGGDTQSESWRLPDQRRFGLPPSGPTRGERRENVQNAEAA